MYWLQIIYDPDKVFEEYGVYEERDLEGDDAYEDDPIEDVPTDFEVLVYWKNVLIKYVLHMCHINQ